MFNRFFIIKKLIQFFEKKMILSTNNLNQYNIKLLTEISNLNHILYQLYCTNKKNNLIKYSDENTLITKNKQKQNNLFYYKTTDDNNFLQTNVIELESTHKTQQQIDSNKQLKIDEILFPDDEDEDFIYNILQ